MEFSRDELRGLVFEVVSELVAGLQKHLDEQILELQADLDTALDKLDAIGIDTRNVQRQEAKIGREWMKSQRREAELRLRVEELERKVKG